MPLLRFLVTAFVTAFGITPPKPHQQRAIALTLGIFLLVLFAGWITLLLWMLFAMRH